MDIIRCIDEDVLVWGESLSVQIWGTFLPE